VEKFSKIWERPQNSGRQNDDMKHVPYWGPTNVGRHGTKLDTQGICTPTLL